MTVSIKFSWIMLLLALFIGIVYCGNSQSQKNVPYQQLTDYTKSDCNGDMAAICKIKKLAKFCGILEECREYLRNKNLEAYKIF